MRRLSPAAALRGALLAAASGAGCALFGLRSGPPAVPPLQPLCFFAIADWGGEQLPPYTTPGQLAVARTMDNVSSQAGSHPAFVLAAGDNFYMDGLPGVPPQRALSRACRARNDNARALAAPLPAVETATRVRATFQDVYTAPGLQVPWYVVAGNHDWVGNITGATRGRLAPVLRPLWAHAPRCSPRQLNCA
jgi:hypothetical protein